MMKLSMRPALAGVLVLVLATVVHADVTLVRDGKAQAKIYINGPISTPELSAAEIRKLTDEEKADRDATQTRQWLVEDVLHHIAVMSGATLEVVTTDKAADVQGPAIVLGSLATSMGATPQDDTVVGEAFRLIVRDDMVLCGGESDIAASHATYHLLRTLGCDWIFPGPEGEVIPHRATITIKDMDVARKPVFEIRAPWYSGGRNIIEADEYVQFEQWKRRQGQTHGRGEHPLFMRGGHFWASLLGKYKDRIAADETMLPMVRQPDGTFKYGKAQLEPTHPGVTQMTIDWIDEQFEKNGWPADKAVAFSIGPNDGGGYSESPAAMTAGARRVDPIIGDNDQTDVLILYANNVLEKLETKYPNLKLGFYIYSVHADYPMRYKPHKNFVAHFADITYSRYHALTDRGSYTRNYYRNILEQWANLHKEQGNAMWFYGYNWNLAENLLPYSKLLISGEDMPYYHKMGVLGHNNEQDKSWANLGPHNYLLARQGWDIDLDWRDVLHEYCIKAFGKGAPYLEQYYLNLVEAQRTAGHEAGSFHAVPFVLDRQFTETAKKLFANAAVAADTARHEKMIDYFSEPVQMLDIFHDYRDAAMQYDFVAAANHVERMRTLWKTYNEKNTNLVSRYGYRYYFKWLLSPFVDAAKAHSTGEYRIVHKFDDALPTTLDPENAGAMMELNHPEIDDHMWIKTQTFGSTWDAQGLGTYRDGGVWYRVHFDLDKALEGKPVGLLIGSVEDKVHVWVNGSYVGMGRGFIKPFLFDLTDDVKYGEDNVIALQVIRAGKLNEAGLGGLLYPSFVFTGPRLEKKAPAIEPLRRVLPGGALGEIEQ